ncbi:MAG: metal-dependent transcriptional regulator [Candidatus Thermoplasmatota archaeon]|nr:metal-dependent transcriptional regulator [Candidatus Thermoplasmatota archaeon]
MNNREDYLLVLWEYGESHGHVTEKNICDRLGTSPATVSEALSKMTEDGLISRGGRNFFLTKRGMELALPSVRVHRISEVFSYRFLEVPWEDVHASVMEMEHVFKGKMVNSLNKNLGYPSTCPHGNPVTPDSIPPEVRAATSEPGIYSLVRVTLEDHSLLKSLADIQALPGTVVELVEGEVTTLKTQNGELKLNRPAAQSVRLRRIQ